MKPTIKDIAKKAKVSTASVSLVIHGHERISQETKRRVQKILKEMNYHPSRSARGLVSNKTGNIGFIVTEDHFLRIEPFYTRIFLGTEFEARENEYYVLLATIPTDLKETDPLPRFILERNVDGVIIAGKVPSSIIRKIKEYKLPIVFVDYYPHDDDYNAVLIDNLNGGIMATEHLINCGHQKIAFIGGDMEHPSIRDRFQGYKTALEKAGILFNPELTKVTQISMSRELGYKTTKEMFEKQRGITAIFASNDAMAMGIMQYLKERGYKVPNDISIIGFDDVEAGISIDPPLTTIKVDKIDLGVKTIQVIADILKNKNKKYYEVIAPVELIVRGSTCNA